MFAHLLQHPTALVHVAVSILALVLGAVVIGGRKGTRPHRRVGFAYFLSMLAVNGTALIDYELYGRFGPFHWAALASLATVIPGYLVARRRRPGWIVPHAMLMTGSYVGLVAALAAEIASRVPGWPFATSVIASSAAVIVIGLRLMFRYVPRAAGAQIAASMPGNHLRQ